MKRPPRGKFTAQTNNQKDFPDGALVRRQPGAAKAWSEARHQHQLSRKAAEHSRSSRRSHSRAVRRAAALAASASTPITFNFPAKRSPSSCGPQKSADKATHISLFASAAALGPGRAAQTLMKTSLGPAAREHPRRRRAGEPFGTASPALFAGITCRPARGPPLIPLRMQRLVGLPRRSASLDFVFFSLPLLQSSFFLSASCIFLRLLFFIYSSFPSHNKLSTTPFSHITQLILTSITSSFSPTSS